MIYFFDSSALVKRYRREPGSDAVNEIFSESPTPILVVSSLSLCEVTSALNKSKNRGEITAAEMLRTATEFYSDCVAQKIGVLDVNRGHLLSANDLILDYNLTSLDAIILACVVDIEQFGPVFVSSDKRLLAAARERHFQVVNPEDEA